MIARLSPFLLCIRERVGACYHYNLRTDIFSNRLSRKKLERNGVEKNGNKWGVVP